MANSKAQAFKEKGNAAFKAGDYPTAIGHYTSAILADPDRKDVTFPLNRAAAYLKLGKYEDTERDCNTVLSISGSKSNVKALFRRGQARVGLGKLFEAQQDFTQVLSQEPSNASASDELKNVTDLIQKEKAKKSKVLPNPVPSPSTTTSDKPEAKRRRVPIRIIGDTSSVPPNGPSTKSTTSKTTATPVSASSSASTTRPAKSNPPEANPSSMATKSTDSDSLTKKTDALQAISSRPLKPKTSSSSASIASDDRMDVDTPLVSSPPSTSKTNNAPPSAPLPSSTSTSTANSNKPKQESSSSPPPQSASSFKEAKQARDAKSLPRVGGGIFRVSGQNTIFASRGGGGGGGGSEAVVDVNASASALPPKDRDEQTKKEKKNDDDDKMDMDIVVSPINPPSQPRPSRPPPPPTTLFDFSRTWYALKSPWEKWAFLNTIPPTQFPGLCKTSLEPSLLVSILDVFLTILTSSSSTPTTPTPTPTPTQTQTKTKTQIRAYMDEFARIPRFSTIVLFLSKPEREVARRVWEELGVDGNRIGGVWMSVGGK